MLSIKQVDDLLTQARTGMNAETMPERLRAARLACLLEMLYATGLRVSELVALPETAARRDQRMLVVRGRADASGWCLSTNPRGKPQPNTLRCARRRERANPNGCSRRSARAGI